MATGEQTAVFAELGEQSDGVFNGRRSVIGESAWYHGHPPLAAADRAGVITEAVQTARNTISFIYVIILASCAPQRQGLLHQPAGNARTNI
jgi:hypothetical protein